jgi:hypothetical protein
MQKWKKFLMGDYPHRRITAVLLLLSVVVMCLVIRRDVPDPKKTDVVTDSSETVESVNENESELVGDELADVEETEESSMEGKIEESIPPEDTILKESEEMHASEEPMTESISVQEVIAESSMPPKEESLELPQKPIAPDRTPEPESVETPEPVPIPEVTPAPEPTPVPEETPMPESTPEPDKTPVSHEHSWSFQDWYQEPTCSNGGLVMEICVHCGETQITGGIPTGEHSYEVETSGDCLSEEVVVCTVCNYREVREKNLSNHIDVEDGFCYGCGKKTE